MRLKGIIFAAGMLSFATSAFGDEYIVKTKDMKSMSQFTQIKGVKIVDSHAKGSLINLDIDGKDPKQLALKINELSQMKDVEYIVKNGEFELIETFNSVDDPSFDDQWSMEIVNASEAWDTTVGSRDIVVAVIDSGVDITHEDLKANIYTNEGEIPDNDIDDDDNGFVDDVHGWDFKEDDNNPDDVTGSANPGHGTHCAGIVGAVGNNGLGISGMSQQVSIMPLRFVDESGRGDFMAAAKAIDYAVDNGAHIISASWGAAIGESTAKPIIEAIERAYEKGILFVAAAANDGKNNDKRSMMPANANVPNVISVAATTDSDKKASWSNFGKANVSLAAPGEDIYSTLPGNKYKNLSGTSMAAPLVSGLAALMLSSVDESERGQFTVEVIKSMLQSTGDAVDVETACNCRVNAGNAVEAMITKPLTIVPAAKSLDKEGTVAFSGFGGTAPYTFKLTDDSVGTITESGEFLAKEYGETKVEMIDATGATVESLPIYVAEPSAGGGDCPLGNELICGLSCAFMPDAPWCGKSTKTPFSTL